jgi:hypothetical protein
VTNASSHLAHEAKQTGFQVESPRASDAVAMSLRNAYARDLGLPEDMAALLSQMNGNDNRSAY